MTSTPAPPAGAAPARAPRVVPARNAVAVTFFLNGFALAAWFARVPAARSELGLDAARLGLLLLAMSAGAVLAMTTAGALTTRFGAARVCAVGTGSMAAGMVAIGAGAGVTGSVPLAAAGLFALGAGSGCNDVAMNVEAALVERRIGRTVMPRFHAGWSIGTVLGALLGALASRADVPLQVHLPAIGLVDLVGTALAVRWYLSRLEPAPAAASGEGAPAGFGVLAAWREPRTLLLGLLVLVVAFTEGTANDWLAVAFVDGHRVDPSVGAFAYGAFVAAMTVGRTAGPVALDRWGRPPVLAVTMLLAVAGSLVAVLAPVVSVAVLGAALWGLGASLGFPVGMSAAADDESRAAARVSVVAVLGYTAFLAGPPVVGLLGDHVGVLRALLVVPVVLIPALALVPVSRPPAPPVVSPRPAG